MDKLVRLEVSFGDEALATVGEVAVERPVARVRPHVGFEVACFVELLYAVAKRAEQQLVCSAGASENLIECFYQVDLVMIELAPRPLLLNLLPAHRVSKLEGFWKVNGVCVHNEVILALNERVQVLNNIFVSERCLNEVLNG